MIKYRNTIAQNANKLPKYLRQAYQNAPIDRFWVDDIEYSGFYDFSYISEKSYMQEPTRNLVGAIPNLNQHVTFLTPRLLVTYKMMNIDEYRRFMSQIKSKNEFVVRFYNLESGKIEQHNMYVTTPSMPKVYTRLLQAAGIIDYSIEFVGTNTGVKTYTITYDYNLPAEVIAEGIGENSTEVTAEAARNIATIIGGATTEYVKAESDEVTDESGLLSHQTFGGRYAFNGWYVENDAGLLTTSTRVDGDAYYVMGNLKLRAKWKETPQGE